MKLPAVLKEYLDKFPEKRLWVTSLDRLSEARNHPLARLIAFVFVIITGMVG